MPPDIETPAELAQFVYAYGAYKLGTTLMAVKSDDLWEQLDRIDSVIPNRRIVLLTRDFSDNLLSITKKDFGPIEPFVAARYVHGRFLRYEQEFKRTPEPTAFTFAMKICLRRRRSSSAGSAATSVCRWRRKDGRCRAAADQEEQRQEVAWARPDHPVWLRGRSFETSWYVTGMGWSGMTTEPSQVVGAGERPGRVAAGAAKSAEGVEADCASEQPSAQGCCSRCEE